MSRGASSGAKPAEGRSVPSVPPPPRGPAVRPAKSLPHAPRLPGRWRRLPLCTTSLAIAAVLHPAPALAAPPGTPFAWGANTYGQLGDGTTAAHRAPATVLGPSGPTDHAAGREHALALMSNGTVRTWGRNNFGQIGDGSTTNRPTPVTV